MPAKDVDYNVSDSKKRQKVKGKKSTTDKKKPTKRTDEESEAWAEYRKQQATRTQKERRAAEFDLRRRQREQASEMEESSDDEFASDTELPDFYESDFESDDDNDDDDEDELDYHHHLYDHGEDFQEELDELERNMKGVPYDISHVGYQDLRRLREWGPLMSHLTPEQIESVLWGSSFDRSGKPIVIVNRPKKHKRPAQRYKYVNTPTGRVYL